MMHKNNINQNKKRRQEKLFWDPIAYNVCKTLEKFSVVLLNFNDITSVNDC